MIKVIIHLEEKRFPSHILSQLTEMKTGTVYFHAVHNIRKYS
jgi:hypothetical protein